MGMIDWNAYRKQVSARVAELGRASPDVVKGYRTLVDAHATNGALDAKTRELIALAVAVTVRCDGCIATHSYLARKRGATADEISDALGVAIMVNAGAALVYSARTLDAFAATEAGGGATGTTAKPSE